MTAPGPHAPPTSRRAAREPRDDNGAPERQADAADFDSSAGTWDDLPDWVGTASPARHRSNYVPAPVPTPGVSHAPETVDGATEVMPPETGLTRRELRAREAAAATRAVPHENRTAEPPATTGPTRREVRGTELLESDVTPARHLRTRRAAWIRAGFALVAAAALLIGATTAITAAVTTPLKTTATRTVADEPDPVPLPESVAAIPAPSSSAVPALIDVCANPEFVAAIGSGDDTTALALAGGAEPFRAAVAAGTAPCVPLDDPAHVWVLVNKTRPYDPIDYRPGLVDEHPDVRRVVEGNTRRRTGRHRGPERRGATGERKRRRIVARADRSDEFGVRADIDERRNRGRRRRGNRCHRLGERDGIGLVFEGFSGGRLHRRGDCGSDGHRAADQQRGDGDECEPRPNPRCPPRAQMPGRGDVGPSCSSPTSHRPGICAPGVQRGFGRGSGSSPLPRC